MSHCRKCRHRHNNSPDYRHRHNSPDYRHHNNLPDYLHHNNSPDYRYCLVGNLIDDFLYQPPIHDQLDDLQQTINLKTVIYIRRCNVQDTYGHLENKAILFQLKSKREIQVNYCSEKQAESEYNVLTMILSRL